MPLGSGSSEPYFLQKMYSTGAGHRFIKQAADRRARHGLLAHGTGIQNLTGGAAACNHGGTPADVCLRIPKDIRLFVSNCSRRKSYLRYAH